MWYDTAPLSWFDLILLGVAFVGITDFLPFATLGLLRGTAAFVQKLLEKASGVVFDDSRTEKNVNDQ